MTVEQVIDLLRIFGFVFLLPLAAFMVGAVISFRRMKNEPELPELPADPEPVTEISAQPENLRRQVGAKTDRKPRGRKQEPIPVAPTREPSVTEHIPPAAQQKLTEIWSRFPQTPEQWICISRQEDTT